MAGCCRVGCLGGRRRKRRVALLSPVTSGRLEPADDEDEDATVDGDLIAADVFSPGQSGVPTTATDIDVWARCVLDDVCTVGFTFAFKRHISRLSREAYLNPTRLVWHLDRWLLADPSAAAVMQQPPPPSSSISSSPVLPYQPSVLLSPMPLQPPTPPTPPPLQPQPQTQTQPPPRVDANWACAPVQTDRRPDAPVPGVVEADGTPVTVYRSELFKNWAATVAHLPAYTFVPRTRRGVLNIVQFALTEGLRVRVAGARHSWGELYGGDNDIIISMAPVAAAEAAVRAAGSSTIRSQMANELRRIQLVDVGDQSQGDHNAYVARVRVGAAATADDIRQWALAEGAAGGNWRWMLSAWPSVAAATSAGCTQTLSYGSGLKHGSVADLVSEVEIVNCKGELQTIRDATQIRAVAGSFGLLGVVVSQVIRFDRLLLANVLPRKRPIMFAVPPFSRDDVSPGVPVVGALSEDDLYRARLRFDLECTKSYTEWCWFPFEPHCWVNCWDFARASDARPRLPDTVARVPQDLHAALARLFEVSALRCLPPLWHTELLGFAAMHSLPSDEVFRVCAPDALLLRRGTHGMPIRSCEVAIEIPPRVDGTPDFSICQKAWWVAINAIHDALPNVPLRVAVEMRIVGSSDAALSPQRYNDFGTCAINLVTSSLVHDDEWEVFIEAVVAQWATLRNPLTGKLLRVRPHFAKEWPARFAGVPIMGFMRHEYQHEIGQFKRLLASACADGGYMLRNAFEVFGNDFLLEFLGETHR